MKNHKHKIVSVGNKIYTYTYNWTKYLFYFCWRKSKNSLYNGVIKLRLAIVNTKQMILLYVPVFFCENSHHNCLSRFYFAVVERQNVSVVTYRTYLRMKQYVLYNYIIRYHNIFDNNGTPLLIWIQQIFQPNPFLIQFLVYFHFIIV